MLLPLLGIVSRISRDIVNAPSTFQHCCTPKRSENKVPIYPTKNNTIANWHTRTYTRTDGPTYTRICIGKIVYISGSLVVAVWCLHSLAFSFLIWAPNQFDILLINSFDRLTFFENYEFAAQTKKRVLSICRWHILAMPSIAKSRHMMILQYLFYCLLSRWLKCCELWTIFWKIQIMQTLKKRIFWDVVDASVILMKQKQNSFQWHICCSSKVSHIYSNILFSNFWTIFRLIQTWMFHFFQKKWVLSTIFQQQLPTIETKCMLS